MYVLAGRSLAEWDTAWELMVSACGSCRSVVMCVVGIGWQKAWKLMDACQSSRIAAVVAEHSLELGPGGQSFGAVRQCRNSLLLKRSHQEQNPG